MTEDSPFYTTNQSFEAVYQVVGVVEIFKEYFNLLALIIAAVALFLLTSYHAGNVKSRRYEIGVLRSLGGKVTDIAKTFFIQSLLIGIVTSVFFVFGVITLTDLVNEILIESFKTYIDSPATKLLEEVVILKTSIGIIASDIALLMLISILASLAPVFAIRKIKPISIVKSRE